MIDPSRDQLNEGQRELWDQGGAIAALINLGQMVRNISVHLSGAIDHVAEALDKERRGNLSVCQRQDFVVVQETIEALLNEKLLRPEDRQLVLDGLIAKLQPEADEDAA